MPACVCLRLVLKKHVRSYEKQMFTKVNILRTSACAVDTNSGAITISQSRLPSTLPTMSLMFVVVVDHKLSEL